MDVRGRRVRDDLLRAPEVPGEGGCRADAGAGRKPSTVERTVPPSPAVRLQIDPHPNNRDPLPSESAGLLVRSLTGERQCAAAVDDPVPGNLDSWRKRVESIADRPCPPREPRPPGDVTVGRDVPRRNPLDHAPDTRVRIGGGPLHREQPLLLGPVARYRKQLTVWSFTTPTACRNA